MNAMRQSIFAAAIAAVALTGAIEAKALQIQQQVDLFLFDSFSSDADGGRRTIDDLSDVQTNTVAQFDPALGVLNAVIFEITGAFSTGGSARLVDDDGVPSEVSGQVRVAAFLRFDAPGITKFLNGPERLESCADSSVLFDAVCTATVPQQTENFAPFLHGVLGSLFAYIGTGTVCTRFRAERRAPGRRNRRRGRLHRLARGDSGCLGRYRRHL